MIRAYTQRLFSWLDKRDSTLSPARKVLQGLCRIFFLTITYFNRNNLSLRSSAMTYTLLLSLVPMLAMSTALVKGLGGGNQLKNIAYTYIETLEESKGFNLPHFGTASKPQLQEEDSSSAESEGKEPLTAWLRNAVDKLFDYVDKTNFTTLGSFGVAGIMITVLLMLNHIETALNSIWGVRSGRSIMRKLADYITLLILFPLSINITFAASAILKHPDFSSNLTLLVPFEWVQALLFQAVPILFITLSLFALYIFFPNTKVKTIPALLGALTSATLWFLIQDVYINLQIGVAKYNAIYGTFASAPLFLVWIYLGWLFILLGAQFAWAIQNYNNVFLVPQKNKPVLQLAAALDITDEVYKSFGKDLSYDTLIDKLSYPDTLTKSITGDLVDNGLLHLSQNDEILLPSCPEEDFRPATIARHILGDEAPNSKGGRQSLAAIAAACQKLNQNSIQNNQPEQRSTEPSKK